MRKKSISSRFKSLVNCTQSVDREWKKNELNGVAWRPTLSVDVKIRINLEFSSLIWSYYYWKLFIESCAIFINPDYGRNSAKRKMRVDSTHSVHVCTWRVVSRKQHNLCQTVWRLACVSNWIIYSICRARTHTHTPLCWFALFVPVAPCVFLAYAPHLGPSQRLRALRWNRPSTWNTLFRSKCNEFERNFSFLFSFLVHTFFLLLLLLCIASDKMHTNASSLFGVQGTVHCLAHCTYMHVQIENTALTQFQRESWLMHFCTVYLCSSVVVLVAVCCSVTVCMVIIAQFELLQLMVSVHARVRVELRRNSSWKHCASAFSFLLWQIAIENYLSPSLSLARSVCVCVCRCWKFKPTIEFDPSKRYSTVSVNEAKMITKTKANRTSAITFVFVAAWNDHHEMDFQESNEYSENKSCIYFGFCSLHFWCMCTAWNWLFSLDVSQKARAFI